jgi:hypothetical protein
MPAFCHAISSIVSPKMAVWSNPREEMPQTTGFLIANVQSVIAIHCIIDWLRRAIV